MYEALCSDMSNDHESLKFEESQVQALNWLIRGAPTSRQIVGKKLNLIFFFSFCPAKDNAAPHPSLYIVT
jgi:hypothetical protein